MIKKIALASLSSVLFLFSAFSSAGDVEDFSPTFKFRNDTGCWPSRTNYGDNSGECRQKSEFTNDKPPVFWERYSETVDGKEHSLITYWVYYSNQNRCSSLGGAHPDDWEMVTVHVVDSELKHVTYGQHNGRYTLSAGGMDMDGTHPVVYVGKYSHGNYHDQRSQSNRAYNFNTGRFCFYWRDPRGADYTWQPTWYKHLTSIGRTSEFPGSTNPLQRLTRPQDMTVCRNDGGRVVAGIIDGTEDTCERNPEYLKDSRVTLKELFHLSNN